MKWKAEGEFEHIALNGEERVVERFAWWPEKIGNTYVWLERYSVEQLYYFPLDEWIDFQVSLDGSNWFPKL
jgi:hypothetical protein